MKISTIIILIFSIVLILFFIYFAFFYEKNLIVNETGRQDSTLSVIEQTKNLLKFADNLNKDTTESNILKCIDEIRASKNFIDGQSDENLKIEDEKFKDFSGDIKDLLENLKNIPKNKMNKELEELLKKTETLNYELDVLKSKINSII